MYYKYILFYKQMIFTFQIDLVPAQNIFQYLGLKIKSYYSPIDFKD